MISEDPKNSEQTPTVADSDRVNPTSNILTQEVFPLLEERLMVDLTRRKIGEVVIRKEIDTQLVQVQIPVRREKLIVEQVSPEYKLLAEIDLGQTNNSDGAITNAIPENLISANKDNNPVAIEFHDSMNRLDRQYTHIAYGSTDSVKAASELLKEIGNLPLQGYETIRIEIILKDSKYRDSYQGLVDRYFQA